MPRRTSIDELYSTIGALVTRATGRSWWRKAGVQSRSASPYAVVWIGEFVGIEQPVVETWEQVPLLSGGQAFEQLPWGTGELAVGIEFYQGRSGDSAIQAANRFKSSLYMEERFWDLWQVCALAGGVSIMDVSAIFRESVEPRADVRFRIVANVVDPLPLEDSPLYDIESQEINVTHVRTDGEETEITVEVNNTENLDDSSSSS